MYIIYLYILYMAFAKIPDTASRIYVYAVYTDTGYTEGERERAFAVFFNTCIFETEGERERERKGARRRVIDCTRESEERSVDALYSLSGSAFRALCCVVPPCIAAHASFVAAAAAGS